MLRIYTTILQTINQLTPAIRVIERRDRDLGKQVRRAAASVALNVAEGEYSRGGNQAARFHSALGSARETLACLEVAVALEYLPVLDESVVANLNQIVATLVKLVRRG